MDANDFLKGGCYALALWLHRKTELPLYGLFDDQGLMHHAMVGDHDGKVMYDARGRVSADWAHMMRGRACAGRNLRETNVEDLEDMCEMARQFHGIDPSDRQVAGFVRKTDDLLEIVEAGPVSAPAPDR